MHPSVQLLLDESMAAKHQHLYQRANEMVFSGKLPTQIAEMIQALVNVHQLMVSQWRNFEKAREAVHSHDETNFATYKRAVEGYESLMDDFVSLFPEDEHTAMEGMDPSVQQALLALKDEFSSNGLPFFTHLKYCQFEKSREVLMRISNPQLRAVLSRSLGEDLMGNISMIDAHDMHSISEAAKKAGLKLKFNDAPGELNDSIEIEGVGSVYVSYDIGAAKKLRQQAALDMVHQIKSERLREMFFKALIGDDTIIDMNELTNFRQIAAEEGFSLQVQNRKGIELDYLIVDGLELPVSYADDVPETER